ncbi:hypothetical protein EJD97_023453 [Solanum chilense]|uniref:Uncharacterized protein n=1 Tax=Solanum chilense TaxID=4083 RepID=A0A6N2AUK2_SOLCI|nr:hypothetical protein EJD97_023453 [Solanum chilense]
MESKFAHIILFFLLATFFQSLMARDLISDGIEVLQLPVENDGAFVCPGKLSWPELVGKSATYAKEVIQKENPNVNDIRVLYPGMMGPFNYVCGRVLMYVDWKAIVKITPRMG